MESSSERVMPKCQTEKVPSDSGHTEPRQYPLLSVLSLSVPVKEYQIENLVPDSWWWWERGFSKWENSPQETLASQKSERAGSGAGGCSQ